MMSYETGRRVNSKNGKLEKDAALLTIIIQTSIKINTIHELPFNNYVYLLTIHHEFSCDCPS